MRERSPPIRERSRLDQKVRDLARVVVVAGLVVVLDLGLLVVEVGLVTGHVCGKGLFNEALGLCGGFADQRVALLTGLRVRDDALDRFAQALDGGAHDLFGTASRRASGTRGCCCVRFHAATPCDLLNSAIAASMLRNSLSSSASSALTSPKRRRASGSCPQCAWKLQAALSSASSCPCAISAARLR